LRRANGFLGQEAVPLIAEPDLNSAIPKPANSDVDFGVVYLLQLNGKVHTVIVAADLTSAFQCQILPQGGGTMQLWTGSAAKGPRWRHRHAAPSMALRPTSGASAASDARKKKNLAIGFRPVTSAPSIQSPNPARCSPRFPGVRFSTRSKVSLPDCETRSA
jgi:hypothetical protein